MSVTYIPDSVRLQLWGKAAGCCQYEHCFKPLYLDNLTKAEFNTSYIAHIVADSQAGPRGDKELSEKLKSEISNLMLLCDEHHRLIDRAQMKEHTVERLVQMKKLHEDKVATLAALSSDHRSHILLYGARIGSHDSPLTYRDSSSALFPYKYPSSSNPIEIGVSGITLTDDADKYWSFQEEQLTAAFRDRVIGVRDRHEIKHFSVFAMAPMPLLIKLGVLFSDITMVDVYQRHREPATWQWQNGTGSVENYFKVIPPVDFSGTPVLNLSLSAHINNERITATIKDSCSIWTVTHDNPNNDFLKTKELLAEFRKTVRDVFDQIKHKHGQHSTLSIFPAMPISASVELGRVWMPKADLPLAIYDQNNAAGGFIKTITIK